MTQALAPSPSGQPDLVKLYPLMRPPFETTAPPVDTSNYLDDSLFEHLITEDEEPVDNLFSAKQQRLLVEPLYSSWADPVGGRFLADANVGVFPSLKAPPLVPDMFLSLQVQVPGNWWQKRHRSYFLSEFGKPPEVVVEIVSNREGEEDGSKLLDYAQMRIPYYLIFDPLEELDEGVLRVYELHHGVYIKKNTRWLAKVGLGVTLWTGRFEGKQDVWLRWCDRKGNLIPTGKERADVAKEQAAVAKEQAEVAEARAEVAEARAEVAEARAEVAEARTQQAESALEQKCLQTERLLAQLRALGVAPLLD